MAHLAAAGRAVAADLADRERREGVLEVEALRLVAVGGEVRRIASELRQNCAKIAPELRRIARAWSPSRFSYFCMSLESPSVHVASDCVSPRVKSAEPCTDGGSGDIRIVIGRTSVVDRPS